MNHGTQFEARATGPGTLYPGRRRAPAIIRPIFAGIGLVALLLGTAACDDDEPSAEEIEEV